MKKTKITRCNPAGLPGFTALDIDGFTVQRQPLRGTPHTLYSVIFDGRTIGKQISYPSSLDCEYYRQHYELYGQDKPQDTPAAYIAPAGNLTERIVNVLKLEKMGLGSLASTLRTKAEVIAPILTRLTRNQVITRSGNKGAYQYEAVAIRQAA